MPHAAAAVVLAVALAAAVTDAAWGRISNALTIPAIVLGLAFGVA